MTQSATYAIIKTTDATHKVHAGFTVYDDGSYQINTITLEDSEMSTDRGVTIGRSFRKTDNLKRIKPAHMREIEATIEDHISFYGLSCPSYGFSGMRGF